MCSAPRAKVNVEKYEICVLKRVQNNVHMYNLLEQHLFFLCQKGIEIANQKLLTQYRSFAIAAAPIPFEVTATNGTSHYRNTVPSIPFRVV